MSSFAAATGCGGSASEGRGTQRGGREAGREGGRQGGGEAGRSSNSLRGSMVNTVSNEPDMDGGSSSLTNTNASRRPVRLRFCPLSNDLLTPVVRRGINSFTLDSFTLDSCTHADAYTHTQREREREREREWGSNEDYFH